MFTVGVVFSAEPRMEDRMAPPPTVDPELIPQVIRAVTLSDSPCVLHGQRTHPERTPQPEPEPEPEPAPAPVSASDCR